MMHSLNTNLQDHKICHYVAGLFNLKANLLGYKI